MSIQRRVAEIYNNVNNLTIDTYKYLIISQWTLNGIIKIGLINNKWPAVNVLIIIISIWMQQNQFII